MEITMEQELLDKVKELIEVRTQIVALKARIQDIELAQKRLDAEWSLNHDKIAELGEKGRILIKELVLE